MSEITRFFIFVIIGVWNTALDFFLFWILIRVFKKLPWPKKLFLTKASVAHTLSFLIANTQSYFLNRTFTFSDSTEDRGFGLYFLVSLVTLSLTTAWIQLLTIKRTMETKDKLFKFLAKKLPFTKKFLTDENWALAAKLSGSVIGILTNFLGYKFIVFS
jgi:putative flippase GtrA